MARLRSSLVFYLMVVAPDPDRIRPTLGRRWCHQVRGANRPLELRRVAM